MGWLSQVAEGPKPSPDGAYEAPNRTSRARCWEARDTYFRCLDRAGILDGIKDQDEALRQCKAESTELDHECASSWVCQSDFERATKRVPKSIRLLVFIFMSRSNISRNGE